MPDEPILREMARQFDDPRCPIDCAPETAEKSGYSHFMLKQIFEQPEDFRLLPMALTRAGIRRVNTAERQRVLFYFHPWELDPHQPRPAMPGGIGFVTTSAWPEKSKSSPGSFETSSSRPSAMSSPSEAWQRGVSAHGLALGSTEGLWTSNALFDGARRARRGSRRARQKSRPGCG